MAKMNAKQTKIFEIIWYTFTGLIMLWGLTYIILGLLSKYLPLPSDNPLTNFDVSFTKSFGLNLLNWGIIILCIGAIEMVIALLSIAKTKDREFDKEQRRKARLTLENNLHQDKEAK